MVVKLSSRGSESWFVHVYYDNNFIPRRILLYIIDLYTFVVSSLSMRNSWYISISASITMPLCICEKPYALFNYHYVKYQYVHFGIVWFSIGEELLCALLCTVQLSLCEVSVCAFWHYLIFHRWETLMCFVMHCSVITMRSISMCIMALFDFS